MRRIPAILVLGVLAVLTISVIPASAQTASNPNTSNWVAPTTLTGSQPSDLGAYLGENPPLPAAGAAAGSTGFPKVDVYVGYAFLADELAWQTNDGVQQNIAGGYAASIAFHLTHNFAFLVDLSGHNGTLKLPNDDGLIQHEDEYYFLFGPQLSHTMGKARVSAHVLAGFTRQHFGDFYTEDDYSEGSKATSFAAGVGGAFDWIFSDRFSWRIMQFDYLFTAFAGTVNYSEEEDPYDYTAYSHINDLRVETGLVIHIH